MGEIEFPEFQKLRASKLRRWVRLGSMVALGWILLKASSSGSWLVSQWPKFSSYVVIWMYDTAVSSKWVLGAIVAFATRVWAFSKYVLGAVVAFATRVRVLQKRCRLQMGPRCCCRFCHQSLGFRQVRSRCSCRFCHQSLGVLQTRCRLQMGPRCCCRFCQQSLGVLP